MKLRKQVLKFDFEGARTPMSSQLPRLRLLYYIPKSNAILIIRGVHLGLGDKLNGTSIPADNEEVDRN